MFVVEALDLSLYTYKGIGTIEVHQEMNLFVTAMHNGCGSSSIVQMSMQQ